MVHATRRIAPMVFLVLALAVSRTPQARAQVYAVTDLGSLGGTKGSGAYALNGEGEAAGYSFITGANFVHAMVNDHGTIVDLGTLGGTQSLARAINRDGDVVGWAYPLGLAYQRAFLWRDGVMQDLGTFGGNVGDAHDINDDGLVVGSAYTAETNEHAFWWKDGVMHDLGTLGGSISRAYACNSWGDISGTSELEGDAAFHAFLGKPGSPLYDLGTLGGPTSHAYDVNDLVHACGWTEIQLNNPASRGFFWADGVMKSVGTLGGIYSAAFGLNDLDQVVGASTRANGQQVAILWSNDQLLDLNALLPPGSGWLLTAAWDIDADGVIVGEGVRPDGKTRAFMLAPAATTSVSGGRAPALRFAGVTPNPVRSNARLGFELPKAGTLSLVLHDLSGRTVRSLATGWFGAGPQSVAWDGRDDDGHALAPGAYFARLVTDSGSRNLRFVVLR